MDTLLLLAGLLLVLLDGLLLVQPCSCPQVTNTRADDMYNTLCKYQRMVFTVTVLESRCNCLPAAGLSAQQLYCQWNFANGSAVVTARTVCTDRHASAIWALTKCDTPIPDSVDGLPLTNRTTTQQSCPYTCQFNLNLVSSSVPCVYRLRVEDVYRGSISMGMEFPHVGPDMLTSCATIGRKLSAGHQYVVGLGGGCSLIQSWSEFSSFSSHELFLLHQYKTDPSDFCNSFNENTPSKVSLTTQVSAMPTFLIPDVLSSSPQTLAHSGQLTPLAYSPFTQLVYPTHCFTVSSLTLQQQIFSSTSIQGTLLPLHPTSPTLVINMLARSKSISFSVCMLSLVVGLLCSLLRPII